MSSITTSRESGIPSAFDTDVIVVGAGPVGLTLACALRHHGVRCRIFERREQPSKNSRAHNLLPRSQELLESIGVRADLAAQAYRVASTKLFLDGRPLPEQPLDAVSSPYPATLMSGQDVIEKTLADLLGRRGAAVERGWTVLSAEPDAEGVTVRVGGPSEELEDQGERLRCRYLVGADGVHGTVRQAVGLDFPREEFGGRATRQIDAKLTWRRSTNPDRVWFFLYDTGFAGVLPVWGGYHRLFFLEHDAEVPDRDPTLPEMVERARQITGDETFSMTDPIWFSHGHFKHGVAPAFAKDRVFLVGDAGHQTLPIGGQGMNAGFHDAVGLAWRLAMTVSGQAGPLILESYSGERQGAHAELDLDQARGFRQLMYRGPVADAALKAAADWIPGLTSKIFGGEDLTQLSVNYRDSTLSEDHFSALNPARRGAARAGDRAPDASVTTLEGETVSLFSRIYTPKGVSWGWTLLAFDGRDRRFQPTLVQAVSRVKDWAWVRPSFVLADPSASERGAQDAACLFDLDGAAHAAYGLEDRPALVLIRPDGHIAFRGGVDQAGQLEAFCRKMTDTGNAAD